MKNKVFEIHKLVFVLVLVLILFSLGFKMLF